MWSVDSRMPDCAARPGPGDWCGGPGCAARRSAAEITGSAARRPVTSSHQHGAALDTVTSPVIQQRGDQVHSGRPGLVQPPAVHPCSDTQVREEMQELLLPDLIGPSLGTVQSWVQQCGPRQLRVCPSPAQGSYTPAHNSQCHL